MSEKRIKKACFMTLLLGNFFHAMVVTGTTPFFRALYSVNCKAKGLFLSNGSGMAFGRKSVLDSGTVLLGICTKCFSLSQLNIEEDNKVK